MGRSKTTKLVRGTESELTVALDLTRRGWQVFTPVVGVCHSCDLIAMRMDVLLRVEVKTPSSYVRKDGTKVFYESPNLDPDKYDLLAEVKDGAVSYHPPLSE